MVDGCIFSRGTPWTQPIAHRIFFFFFCKNSSRPCMFFFIAGVCIIRPLPLVFSFVISTSISLFLRQCFHIYTLHSMRVLLWEVFYKIKWFTNKLDALSWNQGFNFPWQFRERWVIDCVTVWSQLTSSRSLVPTMNECTRQLWTDYESWCTVLCKHLSVHISLSKARARQWRKFPLSSWSKVN